MMKNKERTREEEAKEYVDNLKLTVTPDIKLKTQDLVKKMMSHEAYANPE